MPLLSELDDWSNASLQDRLKRFAQEAGLKTGTVMWPIRIAISGLLTTPGGATEIAEILGKAETLRRIERAGERLKEFV